MCHLPRRLDIILAVIPEVEQRRAQIEALCRKYHVKRLELFGSAARDDFDPSASDVDFLVEFDDYSVPTIADQWFGLQEDLEKLLGLKVDLISSRATRNPYFLQVANRHKVTLYAA
jgi:predicted nucleotidyltransferase